MPTKTDRILSYLPGTFLALPSPTTALYSVVDAFGNELQKAENSLAAVMLAHWVDQADRGADFIQDLACIAALYGLAPLKLPQNAQGQGQGNQSSQSTTDSTTCPPQTDADESVEEFREHLKSYVRTFIEGTVTVQGILRVTAEALRLHIADDYAQIDTWWKRDSDALSLVETRGEDAAGPLFGVGIATSKGMAAQAAHLVGTIDLKNGANLQGASILRLQIDVASPVDVDCAAGAVDSTAVALGDIVKNINTQLNATVASSDGHLLTLTSPTVGANSRLAVQEVNGDAAPGLLGLLPQTYHGVDATGVSLTGTVDLQNGADLSVNHYLRLQIDGASLAEVDCAGANAAATTLAEIVNAINIALSSNVASAAGSFLKLTSPTTGPGSSISILPAAAQDARATLLGQFPSFLSGSGAQPARVTGVNDLSRGVDLRGGSNLRIQVDNKPHVTIDCAGANVGQTQLSEIVAALNNTLGPNIAVQDGRFVTLTSPTSGPQSTIAFELLPSGEDATGAIFGINPRAVQGTTATRASLIGLQDLSKGADLRARHIVRIAADGGSPIEVNVHSTADDDTLGAVTLDEIVAAFNAASAGIASQDGQHLILLSPTVGGASRIDLQPLETIRQQRFVTRAFFTDEAALAIFGFATQQAQGTDATGGSVIGKVDLSRGVDLSVTHYMRIGLDGQTPQEIDCASHSNRPRAAALSEIIEAINDVLGKDTAKHDGGFLVLTSHKTGIDSKITFEPPRSPDALDKLLGLQPATFLGSDATGVSFVGTVDLSSGVDLSTVNHVKIGIDGAEPVEITITGLNPAQTSLREIISAINQAFNNQPVASQDSLHIVLTSPTRGSKSGIQFAPPSGPDATKAIFGISAPRSYHGADATPASIVGVRDLSGPLDLRVARFLRLAVNGQPAVDIDCAANAADPATTTLDDIVKAIKAVLGQGFASSQGTRLALTTVSTGAGARIDLVAYTAPDARTVLLGNVPQASGGTNPIPAILTGDADLTAPIDLEQRRVIRLAVEGQHSIDVDVSGAVPTQTTLDEIVARINNVIPGLAAATANRHLQLTSPTTGEKSTLALLPLRTLELIEYPPAQVKEQPLNVQHRNTWTINNDGASAAELTIELIATQGNADISLLNRTTGMQLRLMTTINSGDLVQVSRDPLAITGIRTIRTAVDRTQEEIPGTKLFAGLIGPQTQVPFAGQWRLSGESQDTSPMLQLNNPFAAAVVVLSARQGGVVGNTITVAVSRASLAAPIKPATVDGSAALLTGWLRADTAGYFLADSGGAPIARLLAGAGVAFSARQDYPVAVYGPLYAGDAAPVMVVTSLADLFDLTLHGQDENGQTISENYYGVTIGKGNDTGFSTDLDITWQITTGTSITGPSKLVRATEVNKADVLILPQGKSDWMYLDCDQARFNFIDFNQASFAGGHCSQRAIFDISRFTPASPETDETVFAGLISDPPTTLHFNWTRYQPGAFVVNLPDDLPERFGSRFNQARFGIAAEEAATYHDVVTEPTNDPDFLGTRLQDSKLVVVDIVQSIPPGWDAMTIPFGYPRVRNLSGGNDNQKAQMYLQEAGAQNLIHLSAREVGAWGNAIAVTVRKGAKGPAHFDVTISYPGVRMENARQTVLGGPNLPASSNDLLQAGPMGILQAKAAGIGASVTRDRTGCTQNAG